MGGCNTRLEVGSMRARANVRHSALSGAESRGVCVLRFPFFFVGVGMVTQLGSHYHLQTNRMK